MNMIQEFLRIIGKTVYAIKSIFIFTFSLFSFLGGIQGECKIIEFKKNATETNCSLEKPQEIGAPFVLKIFSPSGSIDLNENSFLSNFMVVCDFHNKKSLIPVNSMSFGNFSTSNFKPLFARYTTDTKSMVTVPLEFITSFMLNYLKNKDIETELKDVDYVYISLMLDNLTPSANKDRITFLTNKVSLSKSELLLFIDKAKSCNKE